MHLLLKSVALRPEHNPRKYATLSRLQHGEAALASLETALQLLTLHEVQYTNELGAASEPVRQTRGEMAQVFVALSQVRLALCVASVKHATRARKSRHSGQTHWTYSGRFSVVERSGLLMTYTVTRRLLMAESVGQVYLQDLTLQPGWKDKWKDSACLKLVQQALEYDAECEGAFRVLAEVESLQRGIAVMPNNIDVEQDSVSTPVLKTPRVPSRRSKTRARSAAKDVLEEPRTPAQTLARVMSPLTATTAAFSPCATSPAAATPDGFVPMQLQFTPELVPPSCTPKRGKSGSGNPTRLALAHSSPSPAQPADEPLLPMTLEAIFSPAASHSPALRSAPAAATPATPDPSDDPTPALDEAPDPTSLDFFSSPFRSLPTSPPEQPTRGGPISSLTTETRVIAVEENTAGSHRPFAEPFPEPLDEHRQPAAVPMFDFGGWFATAAVAPIYSDSTDAAAEGPASTEAGRVAQVEAAPTEQEPMVAEGAAAERGRGGAVTEVELNSCGEEGEDAGDVEDAETVFVRIAEGYQWSVPSTAAHGRPPGTDIEHDDAHGGFAHVPDDTLTEEMDEQVMAAAAVARRAAEAAREAAEKEVAEVAPRAAKQAAEVAIAEPPDEASVEALATHIETTGEAADQQAPETKVAPEVLIAAEASASGHARVSVGVSRRSSKGGKKKKKGSTKAGR
jgi:hypothetical protein